MATESCTTSQREESDAVVAGRALGRRARFSHLRENNMPKLLPDKT